MTYKITTQDSWEWETFKTWAKQKNIQSYLEIGSYAGFSVKDFARSVLPIGSRITLIEHPTNKDAYEELLKVVQELTESGYRIELIEGDSTNYHVIQQVGGKNWPYLTYDLCFIDANHSFSYVWQDFVNYSLQSVHTALHDIDPRVIEQAKKKYNGLEQASAAHLWMVLKKWFGPEKCTEIINSENSETPRGIGIVSQI